MNTIDKNKKQAVIAGAGPAGLTGAYELLKHTDIHPVVFEESGDIGGISKTVRYQGNRLGSCNIRVLYFLSMCLYAQFSGNHNWSTKIL